MPHQLLQQLLPLLEVLHDVLRAPQQQAAHHSAEVARQHAVEGARGLQGGGGAGRRRVRGQPQGRQQAGSWVLRRQL